MKTVWKEKYIGEIIGGYLEGSYIFIYEFDNIVIVKDRKLICYVNGDTVIEYKDKSQTQKKKLGSSIAGNLIFGTAGALSFGNQTDYILEITWENHQKSLIKIEGNQFYTFFISKLYEKTVVKEKSKEEILNEKIEECNLILENGKIDEAVQKLLKTIPYYKFIFDNHNIYDFDYEIKNNSNKVQEYLDFLSNLDLDGNPSYLNKKSAITRLKMIKSGNIIAKKVYENDPDIKAITDEEYEKYSKYNDEELLNLLKQEYQENIYNKQKNAHEKNNYIYFSNNKEILERQLKDIKDKLPDQIYSFLLKIIKNNSDNIETYKNSSCYIITKIVNAFLGKNGLSNYGYDGGLLKTITINKSVKKHLDKLIEIGNNKELENKYFESLDISEYDDYFKANEIYIEKYIMDENIEIKED